MEEEVKGRTVIGEDDRAHLERAGKWAQFIAIAQFIFIGIGFTGALILLVTGGAMGAMSDVPGLPAGFFTCYSLFIIVMLVLSFFLTLFLTRFATKTLRATGSGNDAAMTEAFENLGKYFRLQGIIVIVSLALCVLMFVGGVLFAIAKAGAL